MSMSGTADLNKLFELMQAEDVLPRHETDFKNL